jgi:uncharacterized membrane protein YphA (DoxX/SURF4 family)
VAYLVLACRVLLALVLLAAALGKLRSRDALTGFRASVRDLGLLPDGWVRPAASAVIAGELAAPALLAVPATTGAGFAVAAVVLASFTAAVLAAVLRRRRVRCRCFGASGGPLGVPHVVRNAALSAAAAGAGWASLGLGPAGLEPAGVVLALGAAAVVGLLVIVFDDLVSLFAADRPAAS